MQSTTPQLGKCFEDNAANKPVAVDLNGGAIIASEAGATLRLARLALPVNRVTSACRSTCLGETWVGVAWLVAASSMKATVRRTVQ